MDCDSHQISIDVSQFGRSGCSNVISERLFHHSQFETRQLHHYLLLFCLSYDLKSNILEFRSNKRGIFKTSQRYFLVVALDLSKTMRKDAFRYKVNASSV